MDDCIFCKIVKGELPSKKEYEDDSVVVFQNIKPLAPVHVLIVPKKHIINISDVSDNDQQVLGKMFLIARDVSKKLGIADAFRVAVANGENAGQSVYHLHMHLTGGWKEKYTRDEDKA